MKYEDGAARLIEDMLRKVAGSEYEERINTLGGDEELREASWDVCKGFMEKRLEDRIGPITACRALFVHQILTVERMLGTDAIAEICLNFLKHRKAGHEQEKEDADLAVVYTDDPDHGTCEEFREELDEIVKHKGVQVLMFLGPKVNAIAPGLVEKGVVEKELVFHVESHDAYDRISKSPNSFLLANVGKLPSELQKKVLMNLTGGTAGQ